MFIWTDIETTGLDPEADEILALGLIITDDNMREIARFERTVHVPAGYKAMRDMSPFVQEMHTKSGLLERVADSRLDLEEVEHQACDFLRAHLGEPAESIKERPPMAGNSVHFDRAFIVRHCAELSRFFNYRLLDVSTLKVLAMATVPGAREWNDSRPDPKHTPISDLEGSIAELAHWRAVLSQNGVQATVVLDNARLVARIADLERERDAFKDLAEKNMDAQQLMQERDGYRDALEVANAAAKANAEERDEALADAEQARKDLSEKCLALAMETVAHAKTKLALDEARAESERSRELTRQLHARVEALKAWIIACRNEVLWSVAHEESPRGAAAESLGQATVALLSTTPATTFAPRPDATGDLLHCCGRTAEKCDVDPGPRCVKSVVASMTTPRPDATEALRVARDALEASHAELVERGAEVDAVSAGPAMRLIFAALELLRAHVEPTPLETAVLAVTP